MADKDWDGHPLGGISVFPVTGVRVGSAMKGTAGVVRVEYGKEPTLQQREAKQFLMNAKQVRELSNRLAELADRLEASEEGSDKIN